MVTQRQVPEMGLIHTKLGFHPKWINQLAHLSPDEDPQQLILWKDENEQDKFVLDLNKIAAAEEKIVYVEVWKEPTAGVDQGDDVAWWLHNNLKSQFDDPNASVPKYRLLRFKPGFSRKISEGRRLAETEETQYADGYPMLFASTESVDLLNSWIQTDQKDQPEIPMERFRPNIVISGSKVAFIEDVFFRVIISRISFRFVKPCDRCVVPSICQRTGKRGKEPSRTLRRHRLTGDDALFGQNVVPEIRPQNPRAISVGDVVEIQQLKPQFRLL
jgi:uncharacterized protein YcbX